MAVFWENDTLVIEGTDDTQYFDMDEIQAFVVDSVCTGVCTSCGSEHGLVEPDARFYRCEVCGENEVHSVIELALEV